MFFSVSVSVSVPSSQKARFESKMETFENGDSLRKPLNKQFVQAVILPYPTCLVSSPFGTPTMLICAASVFRAGFRNPKK